MNKSRPVPARLPDIKVVGVGGGGGNSVNGLINAGFNGVQYLAANTDVMELNKSNADQLIHLQSKFTNLGAGIKPENGRLMDEEDIDAIKTSIKNADLVFIVAALGGRTGTGFTPIFAKIAKEMNIPTVCVVSTPFRFEGAKKAKIAREGIAELTKLVDTLLVVPNEKLLELASTKSSISEAFSFADDVLTRGISGITNLINLKGIVNHDFADLKSILANKGKAIVGTGTGKGGNRGLDAAKKAISSPLFGEVTIGAASGVIISIAADGQFSLLSATAVLEFIQSSCDQDADIIFGLIPESSKESEVVITIIATGINSSFSA